MKRPAFLFYPADWRKDPELRVCSLAARGLWVDMLCLMHEAEPYGHLVVAGAPVDEGQLARLVGEPVGTVRRLLRELEGHGVLSRATDSPLAGAIYSRRMVRDDALRERRGHYGALSANNPNVPRAKDGPKEIIKRAPKDTTKDTIRPSIRPSPSVAVSVSVSKPPTACTEVGQADSVPPAFAVPCVGDPAGVYSVTDAQIAAWQPAYPGVDVPAELRRAIAWLDANPQRRKTARGMPRFLVAWLGRAQNAVGTRPREGLAATNGHSPEHEAAQAIFDRYTGADAFRERALPEWERVAADLAATGAYPDAGACLAELRAVRPWELAAMPRRVAVSEIRERLATLARRTA